MKTRLFNYFAIVVFAALGSSVANAWYIYKPAVKTYVDFIASAKLNTVIDCEGVWDMRDPIDLTSLECETPRLPRRDKYGVSIRNFKINGWDVASRDVLPHITDYAPNGTPGWHRVLVRLKKTERVKEYVDSVMGAMTLPE